MPIPTHDQRLENLGESFAVNKRGKRTRISLARQKAMKEGEEGMKEEYYINIYIILLYILLSFLSLSPPLTSISSISAFICAYTREWGERGNKALLPIDSTLCIVSIGQSDCVPLPPFDASIRSGWRPAMPCGPLFLTVTTDSSKRRTKDAVQRIESPSVA